MQETIQAEDARSLIMDKLNSEGRKFSWLCKEIGVPYGTMYAILVHKIVKLSDDKLEKINSVLGTNFKN